MSPLESKYGVACSQARSTDLSVDRSSEIVYILGRHHLKGNRGEQRPDREPSTSAWAAQAETSNSPEVVEDEEQSPDSSRGNLRNVSRGDELERSDSDTGKEFSDKLDASANEGSSTHRPTQTCHFWANDSQRTLAANTHQSAYMAGLRPNWAARLSSITRLPVTATITYKGSVVIPMI